MEQLLFAVVIIALAAVAYFWWQLRRARQTEPAMPVEKTLDSLEPGDGIGFWDGKNTLVENVLRCTEAVGARTVHWQWVLLSNQQVIEIAPDGNSIYEPALVMYQGTPEFEKLVSEGGILKTFEARVREETSGSQPVYYERNGVSYRVNSTGTFSAEVRGAPLKQEVWRDISPNPGENVYVEAEADGDRKAIGIWTSHIAWLEGASLKESDIGSIYPGQSS